MLKISAIDESPEYFLKRLQETNIDKRKFIDESLIKIRQEVFSTHAHRIRDGLLKLIQINLYGFDVSWAIVPMITLAAQPPIQNKLIGYLGISLTINGQKDLKSLLINTIIKDLSSNDAHVKILSLDVLACVLDENFSPQIIPQIAALLKSPHAQIKRRAIILIFKCINKCNNLSLNYLPKLIEVLTEDEHVLNAIIVTLFAQNREQYELSESVVNRLVGLFLNSSNNRLLNKILKILNTVELDVNQFKKLSHRILIIFQGSAAYSLLFESILFSCKKLSKNPKVIEAATAKLKEFLQHSDLNLQYMSLTVLRNIVDIRRDIVISLKNYVATLLLSQDWSIRLEAIDLMSMLVNRGNIKSLVVLMLDLIKRVPIQKQYYEGFIDTVIEKILNMCSMNNYAYISNFEWYIDILIKLIVISIENPGNISGRKLSGELLDISLRVSDVRKFLVTNLEQIVIKIRRSKLLTSVTYGILIETMVWICSEYISYIDDPIAFLSQLQGSWVVCLNNDTQFVTIYSIMKTLSYIFTNNESFPTYMEECQKAMNFFENYPTEDVELRERILWFHFLIKSVIETSPNNKEIFTIFRAMFVPELKQVSQDAQKKVISSLSFDIDKWFSPELEEMTKPVEKIQVTLETSIVKKKMTKRKVKKPEIIYEDVDDNYPDIAYSIDSIDNAEEIPDNASDQIKKFEPPKVSIQLANDQKRRTPKTSKSIKTKSVTKTRSDSIVNLNMYL